jgi:hypothetical protein
MGDRRTHARLLIALAIKYAVIEYAAVFSGSVLSAAEATFPEPVARFVETYCLDCHQRDTREADLALDKLLHAKVAHHAPQWEAVVRKLATRQMPPSDMPRPEEAEYEEALSKLITELDHHAAEHPRPGRTETFRRLNRTEYQNAIRDLLHLQIDASELLPGDELSHGFDNVTVTGLSPVLLDRYVSAAQHISRLAIGTRAEQAAEKTYRIQPDVTQDVHLPGTPIGTRGGTVVRHHFPQTGEYEIQVWLMRDRNEEIEGLRGTHQLEVLLDRELVKTHAIQPPPRGESDKSVDSRLIARMQVAAGPHDVAVVFPKRPSSLLETVRQPLNVHFNYYRHPRIEPAVYQVAVRGPFEGRVADETPSRQRIFVCYPEDQEHEFACAEQILTNVMRRAYRRELKQADVDSIMSFFRQGNQQSGFDTGIERALSAILVNPNFLFRIERDPDGIPVGSAYQVPPIELASRLAFFLWSSIPDDELRELAIDGQLAEPEILEAQVRRMLSDERSESLIRHFGGQWLYLRNLDSVIPDMRRFPDFDDNLRQAMRTETELFLTSIVREDRSVLDLIDADYTYLNERLAKHYRIPHVYGSHFRRVQLDEGSRRGGLLRHGSILTVTSYATRTSPVLRGHWVLKNLLGSPPPPPPPSVPTLEEATVSASRSVRERLEQHRADRACTSCHQVIDSLGFAMENYDAVGRWRDMENERPIDVSGTLLDGSKIEGVAELEQHLLKQPDLFVQTLVEKLMTFALGRGMQPEDAPAVRHVVRRANEDRYRFSAVVLEIAKSVPFQMRTSE